MSKLEDEAGLDHDETLYNDAIAYALLTEQGPVKSSARPLFRRPYLFRGAIVTLHLTAALMLFYVLQVFGPTLLHTHGLGTQSAIVDAGLMMLIAGVGSIVQGYLSDIFGRKRILCLYTFCATLGCILFALSQNLTTSLVAGFLTAFFGLGIFPVSKLSVAEQYPTELGGRGVYLGELSARFLSGIVTTYCIPFILKADGENTIFIGIAVVLVLFSLPFFLFGRETANIELEQAGVQLSLAHFQAELMKHKQHAREVI